MKIPITVLYAVILVAGDRFGVDPDLLTGLSGGPPILKAARNHAAAILYEITDGAYGEIASVLGIHVQTATLGIVEANRYAPGSVSFDAALAKRYIEVNVR